MNTSISRRILVLAACTAGVAVWAAASDAAPESFTVALSGSQQVPAVETPGKGTADSDLRSGNADGDLEHQL